MQCCRRPVGARLAPPCDNHYLTGRWQDDGRWRNACDVGQPMVVGAKRWSLAQHDDTDPNQIEHAQRTNQQPAAIEIDVRRGHRRHGLCDHAKGTLAMTMLPTPRWGEAGSCDTIYNRRIETQQRWRHRRHGRMAITPRERLADHEPDAPLGTRLRSMRHHRNRRIETQRSGTSTFTCLCDHAKRRGTLAMTMLPTPRWGEAAPPSTNLDLTGRWRCTIGRWR